MTKFNSEKKLFITSCVLEVNRELNTALDITWNDFLIIAAINMCEHVHRPANMSTLSQMTNIPHTTARRLTGKLIRIGWVIRLDSEPYKTFICAKNDSQQERLSIFGLYLESLMVNTAYKLNHCQCGEAGG